MEYKLTLTSAQMAEIHKAVELLMRIKLGQYQELIYDLCDIKDAKKAVRISEADTILKQAFAIIYENKKPSEYKDAEWFILYDLYQVLRKSIHDAEYPYRPGLDDSEPMHFSKEPLPKCEWKE